MKVIKRIIIFIILVLFCAGSLLIHKGYKMYKQALDEISVQDKVQNLRAKRNYTNFEDLPEFYKNAVVAVEDRRFYEHGALDLVGIARAMWTNIKSLELKEGGSSITQQVAKNVYFTQEKTLLRKIAEVFMAFEIERNCDKNTILEIYVNTSYFGNGYYGIREAANGYYDKDPLDMNKYECTMMAGVPNAPSVYAPTKNPDIASQRQKQVLDKMVKYKYITQDEMNEILKIQAD